MFKGFTFRVIALENNELGLAIDKSNKYLSKESLPAYIDRTEFIKKIKGKKVIYEYGDSWYEIKIHELSDLNSTECKIESSSLYDLVLSQYKTQKSRLALTLPRDSAVLVYQSNLGMKKNVPSGLCRFTYSTKDVRSNHRTTIVPPYIRRRDIKFIVDNFLRKLNFNSKEIILSNDPLNVEIQKIKVPSLKFGNGSIMNSNENLQELPKKKQELLYSKDAGFYVKKRFDKQYFIIPQSVYSTYGAKFISTIKEEIEKNYSNLNEHKYDPEIIVFDDTVRKSVHALARKIIQDIEKYNVSPGYGVVMIPRLPSSRINKEDELANILTNKLHEKELYVSVIHTEIAEKSFEQTQNNMWAITDDRKQRSKFNGYIRNVVLNKILLLNDIYPFILNEPINSDLVIGIDIKKNTAGFTLVSKNADKVYFEQSTTEQKEQLSRNHIAKILKNLIVKFIDVTNEPLNKITIHRDGRLFHQEKIGIKKVISDLKTDGKLPSNCVLNLIEIRKTARAPIRIVEIVSNPYEQKEFVRNPVVGTYTIFNNEAFLITTGFPYRHNGTCVPLHIICNEISGGMKECIEDVFSLCNLTWTKIDDCSRVPLTIKFGDIKLKENAEIFDHDKYEFEEGGDLSE
ncbi:MAG: hypothetical protein K9N07_11515 [Candidatus Cloacimonetes bacterium]|nr:hypothetical protein [Candidatus Cloacimonadota bacterium]